MRFLRQHLSWLLLVWLSCQTFALSAPVVLAAAASAPVEELCTCPGGDHETCPMHHGTQSAAPGAPVCGATACCAPVDVALLSLAGGAGILPDLVGLPLSLVASDVAVSSPVLSDIAASHDTPPPRL
jgi:hypothetical protein